MFMPHRYHCISIDNFALVIDMILNVGMSMSVAATLFLLMIFHPVYSYLLDHLINVFTVRDNQLSGILDNYLHTRITSRMCSVDRRHGPLDTGYYAQMRDCRRCHLDSCPNVIISWLLVLVPGLATD